MDTENKILSTYYNPTSSGSFGGVNRLKDIHKNVPSSQILKALQSSSTYTKHKNVRHTYSRRKVNVHTSNYLWQVDLIILNKYAKVNKNFNYLLTVIDTFSKKAYVEPIKRKTGGDVTIAFSTIIRKADTRPKYLACDMGKEFFNKTFEGFLKENDIKMFSVHSVKKACVVERFNQTLMQRMQKYFDFSKSHKYIDVLQDIVTSYNNSKHRTIGMSPNSVDKYNEMDVWLKTNKDLYSKKWTRPKSITEGSFVRLKIPKSTFEKAYSASYSSDIYRVGKVLDTKPTTFKLIDKDGDCMLGSFYKEELSQVSL